MKSYCLVLSLLLFTVGLELSAGDGGAQNITSTINTARFILFGGTYTVPGAELGNGGKTGDRAVSAVFKLDTYTGKTWILKVEKAGNSTAIQWIPVEDAGNIAPDKETSKNDDGQKQTLKSLKTLDE